MGQKYVWQGVDWPNFSWNSERLMPSLGQARKAQGQILAKADIIGLEARADLMVEEAFATSAIEGESLDRNMIRSSVARRLGLPTAGLPSQTRHVDGLVEMLLDATVNFDKPLTSRRLHGWQAALFPTGYSGIHKIQVGSWRTGKEPMRVISGSLGSAETVHFEAPPSDKVGEEMRRFLDWWKTSSGQVDGLIRAGLAHFWFVTIHPFDDGNGRISRAITDMALAQDESSQRRLYNLSTQILKERESYYQILETSQKGSCDITLWLEWFLNVYVRAIETSKDVIKKALMLAKFWRVFRDTSFNNRQKKIIEKLLEFEPQGFEGGLTNRKYVSITKISPETAKRDLADLEEKGVLKRNESKGRSTSYRLNKNW